MNRYRYPNFKRPPYDDPLTVGRLWIRNALNRDEPEPPLLYAVEIDGFAKEQTMVLLKEVDAKDINYRQIMYVKVFEELYEPI